MKALLLSAVVFLTASYANAEERGALQATKPPFASCGWWQSLKTDAMEQFFRIGFAQGMVVGSLVDLLPDTPTEAARPVFELFKSGQEVYLQRPSMLEDYFDKKCGDPRNGLVRLHGLALLAILETGGLKGDRIDAALQLFRKELAPRRDDVLAALSRQ